MILNFFQRRIIEHWNDEKDILLLLLFSLKWILSFVLVDMLVAHAKKVTISKSTYVGNN